MGKKDQVQVSGVRFRVGRRWQAEKRGCVEVSGARAILSMDGRKRLSWLNSRDSRERLSVMSGRRREAAPIEPLKAKGLRCDVRESARSLSC